jgi:hypothetical protein
MPDRDGLELAVTRLDGPEGTRLLLEAGNGAAILELGTEQGFFVFSHGKARLASTGDQAGRAFVTAVAEWLGLAAEEDLDLSNEDAGVIDCSWVRLGDGDDGFGVRWDAYKLFFKGGERYAEVFFRLSDDAKRAQFLEKWSKYRSSLVELVERAVVGAALHKWRRLDPPETSVHDRLSVGDAGCFEAALPKGWRVMWREEGHWRMTDADDEMMIEMSSVRLPPLPPEAPDAVARLRAVIDGSEHRARASDIAAFERAGVIIAWSEYSFLSSDTKRPEAAPRPAKGRWLIATNAWVQVLITGCWWDEDAARAEMAWEGVVRSLRLFRRLAESHEEGQRGSA